jgi:two-component system, sensor histidine kinase PdtaS
MIRLIFLIVLFLIQQDCRSQKEVENPSTKYSPAMQRLLIKMVGTHLYNIYQWQIDYDSSIVLACEGEGLSHSLIVNESFDDGSPLPGKELIDRNNISGAIQLLTTLRGEDRIKLLLQLGGHFLFKPGSAKRDMSNAYNYLTEASALGDSLGIPKWKNGSRNMLGKYYYHAGDFSKSKTFLSEVVNACNKSRDTIALAKALAERGACELFSDTSKLNDIKKALELFKKQDDKVGQIEMISKISEIHFIYGLWTEAEKELLEAVDLEKGIGFRHVHYYYNALAFIQNSWGNSNIALSYANKAISTMEEINDRTFSFLFYFREGNIYGGFGDWDRSAYWYRKAMASAGQANTNRLWYSSFVWLSTNLVQMEKYKEALELIDSITVRFPPLNPLDKMYLTYVRVLSYYGLKQASLAEKNLAELAVITNQLSSQPQMYHDVYRIYSLTAIMYSSGGDMKKAKEYLQKSLAIKTGSIDLDINVNLALAQFKIDSSEGRYLSAIRNYQRYEQLNDSGFNLKRTRQIDEMSIQYNVQQKEKDLQLLQNREQLQKAELSREKLTRNIIIIISSLLLLLFALVYNRYRTKRRSNELLQVQQKIISQKNEALQKTISEKDNLLEEKEWLVREIHHRVKNNLQMVISLLNAQSEYLHHPSALHAIKESRERMQAIAILHQKLYKVEGSAEINMRSYIHELVENIQQGFDKSERIHFQVDVAEIGLDMSQSVPLGLILNEAITNAIKYAYPKNAKGSIQISLQQIEGQQLQLIIADRGIGLPEGFDIEHNHSLGMQLIKLFAEQLEGELFFVNRNGLKIVLSFKSSEYSKASINNLTGITI